MKSSSLLDPRATRLFRSALLHWYEHHQRNLPWRKRRDPYRIWVSEIMLQQTRVAAVVERYPEFLSRFPTVRNLARARLETVLAAWSGLGYYRRARHMHAAARQIVHKYRGKFPVKAEQLRTLPGIGRYTAAAVASIAFGQPCAVVDGNVERTLRRLLGIRGSMQTVWAAAEQLLSRKRPGEFNQALMELGATVCLPVSPRCVDCPVAAWCKTRGPGEISAGPVRRTRQLRCVLATSDGQVYLVRRGSRESVMPGLWELPVANGRGSTPLGRFRHAIMQTDFQVSVVRGRAPKSAVGVPISRLAALPLTGLAHKILLHFGLLRIK